MKEKHIILSLFIVSIVLIGSAFFLIGTSFSSPDYETNTNDWDIRYGDVVTDTNYILNNQNINMYINLNNDHRAEKLQFVIYNDGNIDAVLKDIQMTNINNYLVFEKDGNKYYLSDFVDYNISYLMDNAYNDVISSQIVETGDVLNKNTNNVYMVTVSLKNELSEDVIEYLNNNELKVNLSLSLVYSEK